MNGRHLLSDEWKVRLGLLSRSAAEFYEENESVGDVPYAGAIRTALRELNLSGLFCVQGVPTIVFLSLDEYDPEKLIAVHAALWNQGLASLLMVASGDTLRAFSLAKKPLRETGDEFEKRCLVETLEAVVDVLRIQSVLSAAESGRLWQDEPEYFQPKERVDQVLLDNLTESHRQLCDLSLPSQAAQALLIQAMFIAYLEDRGITSREYFARGTGGMADTFLELLRTGKVSSLSSLFGKLREDFNGDLFVAPCSFDSGAKAPALNSAHLDVLSRFRSGEEEMVGGQRRFWGYDFKYIPIELISAVYDRFLEEEKQERREQGAYYTPMFLADAIVSQVWELLPTELKVKCTVLDPACGSGVFLVRFFQRSCEFWRSTHQTKTIRWDVLRSILDRINGWDVNENAVRVAVFSLYVALMEEVSPPDLQLLLKRGRILPGLWTRTMVCQDFFSVREDRTNNFDVIVGNPPWSSRQGSERSHVKWSEAAQLPLPAKEAAWAFAWKSLRHISQAGIVGLLLPAMGFLHNQAEDAIEARNQFLVDARIRRIVNFADLRFLLFDKAQRAAALLVFAQNSESKPVYRIEYWVPKARPGLFIKRVILVSTADKASFTSEEAVADPLLFTRRMWMHDSEAKLFNYLRHLTPLSRLVKEHREARTEEPSTGLWIIGQGFQPFNEPTKSAPKAKESDYVGKVPDLPVKRMTRLAQSATGLAPWRDNLVRRKGYERGFHGPRVLVSRAVEVSDSRLRASYVEAPLTFQDIIQAIAVPIDDVPRAKVLAAFLNSRLATWFAFHGTSSFSSDRQEVKENQLLTLPFPAADEVEKPQRARAAAQGLISLVDAYFGDGNTSFRLVGEDNPIPTELDDLTYDYFGLSKIERTLVDDVVANIIPGIQPTRTRYPDLWRPADVSDRHQYASLLLSLLREWFDQTCVVGAKLVARNSDLAILKLSLESRNGTPEYTEEAGDSFTDVLTRLSREVNQPLDRNFQVVPNFRIFIGRDLYLIKPTQKRYWLKSTAIADSDSIAMDLQTGAELHLE